MTFLYSSFRKEFSEPQSGKPALFSNPFLYAPTGDIYSYFQRRQLSPFAFAAPTVHAAGRLARGLEEDATIELRSKKSLWE
jgi:hypothetical protein